MAIVSASPRISMSARGCLITGAGMLVLAGILRWFIPLGFEVVGSELGGGPGTFWLGSLLGIALAGVLAVGGFVLLLIGSVAVGVRLGIQDATASDKDARAGQVRS